MRFKTNLFLGLMFLSSCSLTPKEGALDLNPAASSPSPQQIATSAFQSMKEKVFFRCTTCHQQYDRYDNVIRELSAIQASVAVNRMPKSGGPLTDTQKKILADWIAAGAPDQAGAPIPNPASLEPTWKSLSENVFFPKCLVCHNPNGQAKFLDLSNRNIIFANRDRVFGDMVKLIDVDQPEKSYLLQTLNDDDEPMPPVWSNIPRLTPTELQNVTEWIRLGLP